MEITTEWLNQNEHRRFPIAGNATAKDNSGKLLPDGLIADLSIMYSDETPSTGRPYLSSLVMGPSLVAIAVSVNNAVILSLSLPKPVPVRAAIPLKASAANCSGYVTFGIDINSESGAYLFSSYEQSMLEYKAAKRFSSLPISHMTVAGNSGETIDGIVNLTATDPIKINYAGNNVVELSLKESERRRFLGQCDNALSPQGCGPAPLRKINGVGPDSNGNIFIEVN